MDKVGLTLMRYAFPCAEISIRLGTITQAEYDRIEAALLEGTSLPKEDLEQYFPAAVRRMKEVAKQEGIGWWSMEALHSYFLKRHDEYIDEGEGMLGEMMDCEKEMCKCTISRVTDVLENPRILVVKTDKGEQRVFGKYLPAKKGDIIVVHRRFATEVLDPETATEFR